MCSPLLLRKYSTDTRNRERPTVRPDPRTPASCVSATRATHQANYTHAHSKVITWLQAKKISFKEVDAIDEKDVRDELTAISGIKGNYPQVFITDQKDETTFVGTFDAIESLVDMDGIDAATLEANPDIKTFSSVFAECKE